MAAYSDYYTHKLYKFRRGTEKLVGPGIHQSSYPSVKFSRRPCQLGVDIKRKQCLFWNLRLWLAERGVYCTFKVY